MSLTSVRQPFDAAGEHVVRLLIAALHEPASPDEHVLLEPELVVRASTEHPDRKT